MESNLTLKDLRPGESGRVRSLGGRSEMRRRLRDIGLVEGTKVVCTGKSPGGDPSAYLIRGAVIAIRAADGQNIQIEPHGEEALWD